MKKGLLFFIFIGLLIPLNFAYAGEAKIGYIDVQRVLNKSRRGIEARKIFQIRGNELNKVIQKSQEELKALKESLEKQAAMLSEEARREKEREYQRKLKELERLVKDSRDELKQMEMEITTKLLKSMEKVVTKLGKEGNYTLILEKKESFILYAPKEIELTDKVIKAFDAAKE
ncbi:MAG: OmpH family outer membrane protein [Deltaproteobacteria bacterium]|nr:OmpH family outer membrane protein [Deltaproteobacteria bacterium]